MTIVVCDNCGKKNRVPAVATGVPHCSNCHAPLAWIADAGDDDYADVVEAATLPTLVDLWAPWCGPCRMVSPALENLAHEFSGRVKLVKVNVDESPRVAQQFGVQGIPTLLVVRGADVIARQTGAAGEVALRSWLRDALAQLDRRAHAPEGV
ncbi:MAG TPA: thioredoxin [Acidimicrobiia bacterium]